MNVFNENNEYITYHNLKKKKTLSEPCECFAHKYRVLNENVKIIILFNRH